MGGPTSQPVQMFTSPPLPATVQTRARSAHQSKNAAHQAQSASLQAHVMAFAASRNRVSAVHMPTELQQYLVASKGPLLQNTASEFEGPH